MELLSDKGLLPEDQGPGFTAVVFGYNAELQVWDKMRVVRTFVRQLNGMKRRTHVFMTSGCCSRTSYSRADRQVVVSQYSLVQHDE